MNFPHFLGIGAQRSATSWLNKQLERHQELWVPPIKELHYFDTIGSEGSNLARRWMTDLPRLLRKSRKVRAFPCGWSLRFLFGRETDAWYQSLFKQAAAAGRITGEVTPAYAILPREMIQRIHRINPRMKLVFLMRDPIDRAWSYAVKHLCRGQHRAMEQISDEEFHACFGDPTTILKSSYMTTIRNWESVFPREQIFYGFYDEVCTAPRNLCESIFRFLEVDSGIPPTYEDAIHNAAARDIPLPKKFERRLAEIYLRETACLAEHFGERAQQWHRRCVQCAPPSAST